MVSLLDDENDNGVPEILAGAGDFLHSHGRISRDDRVAILAGRDGRTLWRLGVGQVAELSRPAK